MYTHENHFSTPVPPLSSAWICTYQGWADMYVYASHFSAEVGLCMCCANSLFCFVLKSCTMHVYILYSRNNCWRFIFGEMVLIPPNQVCA